MTPFKRRMEKGASSWLSALPNQSDWMIHLH